MATPTVRAQALRLLTAVAVAYTFSVSLVIYNKWLFTVCDAPDHAANTTGAALDEPRCLGWGFPYPFVVTAFHMLFLCIATRIYTWAVPAARPTLPHPYRHMRIALVGVLVALDIVLTNTGFLFLEASFIEMIKSAMPASVLLLAVLSGLEERSLPLAGVVLLISVGLAVASAGEVNFRLVGFLIELLAVLCGSGRLIVQQLLLRKSAAGRDASAVEGLSPLQLLYYQAPVAFLTLLPAAAISFGLRSDRSPFLHDLRFAAQTVGVLVGGGLFAIGLNLGDILIVDRSSALTCTVIGTLKTSVVIGASWLTFRNAISWVNLSGYLMCLVGVVLYQRLKLRKMVEGAAHEALRSVDAEGAVVTSANGESALRERPDQSREWAGEATKQTGA